MRCSPIPFFVAVCSTFDAQERAEAFVATKTWRLLSLNVRASGPWSIASGSAFALDDFAAGAAAEKLRARTGRARDGGKREKRTAARRMLQTALCSAEKWNSDRINWQSFANREHKIDAMTKMCMQTNVLSVQSFTKEKQFEGALGRESSKTPRARSQKS